MNLSNIIINNNDSTPIKINIKAMVRLILFPFIKTPPIYIICIPGVKIYDIRDNIEEHTLQLLCQEAI